METMKRLIETLGRKYQLNNDIPMDSIQIRVFSFNIYYTQTSERPIRSQLCYSESGRKSSDFQEFTI